MVGRWRSGCGGWGEGDPLRPQAVGRDCRPEPPALFLMAPCFRLSSPCSQRQRTPRAGLPQTLQCYIFGGFRTPNKARTSRLFSPSLPRLEPALCSLSLPACKVQRSDSAFCFLKVALDGHGDICSPFAWSLVTVRCVLSLGDVAKERNDILPFEQDYRGRSLSLGFQGGAERPRVAAC